MPGQTEGWKKGWMEGRMEERMDGRADGPCFIRPFWLPLGVQNSSRT